MLDNTDATIRYSDGWRQEVANNKQYSNGSAHNSGTAGSTVLIPYVLLLICTCCVAQHGQEGRGRGAGKGKLQIWTNATRCACRAQLML